MIKAAFMPELQRALARWIAAGGDRGRLVRDLAGSGRDVAGRLGIPVIEGLRLPGREWIVPSFTLAGLGRPWLITVCEVPGTDPAVAPEVIDELIGLATVEAVVRLTLIEERETARLRLRLIYPEGEDPVPVEGNSLSLRQRRKSGCRGGSAPRSARPD